jgi:bifunctional non-homologous end joining protein LigD
MLAIDDLAGLLELVQASVLEIHPWGSTVERPERPKSMTIDLDPAEDVSWERVIEAAFDVRKRLAELGLQGFVKTTGGKGLHIVVPLAAEDDWGALQVFVQGLARRMAAEQPERYTASMAKADRRGRIYVDYLRNRMGATAVAAYSTRARPGAAVSVPLAWDELSPGIRSNHFTVENLPKRLAALDSDPWDKFFALRQRLPVSDKDSPSRRRSVAATSQASVPDEQVLRLLPGAVAPPEAALTAYWQKVANRALHHLARRPLQLVRAVAGKTFYHRGALPTMPDAVHELRIEHGVNADGVWPWVDSLEGILGLVAVGVVELHPWSATVDDIEQPDTLVFDLDPGEDVPWQFVVETALRMRELLRTEGLESWPKLTGGRGAHVMVPVEPELDWQEAHAYSHEITERIAKSAPDRYLTSAAANRTAGRLVVDGGGMMSVGAFSPRALPGFPIAAPVSWLELERGVAPDAFTIFRPPRAKS